ncbi:MAG: hypothetical protein KC609_26185 [Myxococcales bacterium]|nr:hypothetical protein [Myxococcales bacterium]
MTQARSISIAVVLIVVVFGAGFAGGYFWPKRTTGKPTPPDQPDPREPGPQTKRPHRGRMLRHMVDRLSLDEAQVAKVKSILRIYKPQMRALHAKIRPEVDAIRAKMRDEIRKVLTDTQRSEFDRMLQEFHRRRRRPRMRRRDLGPRPFAPLPRRFERRGPLEERRRPGLPPAPTPPEPKGPSAPK